jgi:hypothetical protein
MSDRSREWRLYRGKSTKPLLHVAPDGVYPGMWRVRHLDGRLTDMANLTWVKDAAVAMARRQHSIHDGIRFRWGARGRGGSSSPAHCVDGDPLPP